MTPTVLLALDLLLAWLRHAEADRWQPGPGLSCYGTGYGHWGVHTTLKHIAAAATCAELHPGLTDAERAHWRTVAVEGFRFVLATHQVGDRELADGTRWSCTWITALGLERMAFALPWIVPRLTPDEQARWRRLVETEADWLADQHVRGKSQGVAGSRWSHEGANNAESNIWNGAFLWRAGCMFPDHPHAAHWQERAVPFLATGVSVPADATDQRLIDGKPLAQLHGGPNFFANLAFDHHGYLNVGYMSICASNAGILHFDAKTQGWKTPQALHLHQDDLARVLTRMRFGDGRMARIGGDSRVRYAYCQEFDLISLLYAADKGWDAHALEQAERLVALMAHEARDNGDGSFYGKRLANLRAASPYFVTRLESDRALALAAYARWRPLLTDAKPAQPFAAAASGSWCDPEHGAALVRSPRRFASVSWRSYGLATVLCLPPEAGDMAEWLENGTGSVRFVGEDESISLVAGRGTNTVGRSLIEQHTALFPGGFLASAHLREGEGMAMSEGFAAKAMATTRLVAVALPDDATVVVLRRTRGDAQRRAWLRFSGGLRLQIPNDVFNGRVRSLASAAGSQRLDAAPAADLDRDLGGSWACVDGKVGAVGLYGAAGMSLHRSAEPRGGAYRSLRCEELWWGRDPRTRPVDPGVTILDAGWLLLSADAATTAAAAADHATLAVDTTGEVRRLRLRGRDGKNYQLIANLGDAPQAVELPAGRDLLAAIAVGGPATLAAGAVVLVATP